MLGGADNPNGELLSYIIGADIMARKSTNLCTVYWNVLGHSVHSTDLICRSGDYKATDSGNYTMPSVAQQQGAADNRQ